MATEPKALSSTVLVVVVAVAVAVVVVVVVVVVEGERSRHRRSGRLKNVRMRVFSYMILALSEAWKLGGTLPVGIR